MKKISFLFLSFLIFSQVSYAAPMSQFPPSEWTNRKGYLSKTTGKLGFGLLNVVGGWTAISTEYYQQPEDNPAAAFIRSIARTVTNTVGGALHVATFPVPVDIRLPGGGTVFE